MKYSRFNLYWWSINIFRFSFIEPFRIQNFSLSNYTKMSGLKEIQDSPDSRGVGIVGAGLVGCLAALAFAAKGFSVTLFELRSDPRLTSDRKEKNLRSINLAVSNRGIRALKYVDEDMADRVLEHIIPMKGRMIHDITGTKQESQLYGLFGECIHSIDRSFLNECLLNEMRHADIKVLYNHKLIKIENLYGKDCIPKMIFSDRSDNNSKKTFEFDYIIGADGSHSQFRYQMQKTMRMNFSQQYIDMQYIELYIPPSSDTENKFAIDANHLHIWPRHNYMLIALPNQDGSFTSTFFSPWSIIENITNDMDWIQFFKDNFPDALELIGESSLKDAFNNNPRGSLVQIDAYPYHHPNGRALIIGDAAHSMVPFYGQGMNCGFEDVRVLFELIDKHEGNVSAAFANYSQVRRSDLQAICKLALDNYYEMSSKVINPLYLLRKKFDYFLGKHINGKYFQWLPLYTMISFRDDISYSQAVQIEQRQQKILRSIQLGTITTLLAIGAIKAANYWNKFKATS